MLMKRKTVLPYPWSDEYQNAILELDSRKIMDEISTAEASIERRKSELLRNIQAANSKELAAITRALRALIQLREIEQHRAEDPS